MQSGSADRGEEMAQALTLNSEVTTLHKILEKRLDCLDKAILDLRAYGGDTITYYALKERRELIQQGLERRGLLKNYPDQISLAVDHLREDQFGDAINLLADIRLGLYKMLDDIASAEYLLIIEPRVKRLRDIWRSQKKAEFSASGGFRTENEIKTEAGYRQAEAKLEAGKLYEAFGAYRQLASDYQSLVAD